MYTFIQKILSILGKTCLADQFWYVQTNRWQFLPIVAARSTDRKSFELPCKDKSEQFR